MTYDLDLSISLSHGEVRSAPHMSRGQRSFSLKVTVRRQRYTDIYIHQTACSTVTTKVVGKYCRPTSSI